MWVYLSTIAFSAYMSACQWWSHVFSRPKPVEAYAVTEGKTPTLAVPYLWNGQQYLAHVAYQLNAPALGKIMDAYGQETDEDVTEVIRMWAGPYRQITHKAVELGLEGPIDIAYLPDDDHKVRHLVI